MVTLIAHLNVTIKHLTRYNQKVVLAAMLEGKSMPSNMAVNTNYATSNFGNSKITTNCLREALVT